MEKYLKKVKIQLECNASDPDKDICGTYSYTNKQVDENLDYFYRCKESGLSAYKALLFFDLYLEGDYDI